MRSLMARKTQVQEVSARDVADYIIEWKTDALRAALREGRDYTRELAEAQEALDKLAAEKI